MIGSLMSRMGDAQKLSVPQLQKAIQSGVLPAYIGIPIIQDKLQQAKGAAQPVAPKSPIAQEILQQANQPQIGVEGLPSNLPTQAMAGGGIVAFADGGLSDDEEAYEQAIEDEEFDRYQSLLANAGEYPKAEDTSAPPEKPSATSVKSTENKGVGINPNSTGGIGIKDLLAAKAAQHKIPAQLLDRIAFAESGHKLNVGNNLSSAKGLFGFTSGSWKGMGGTEENRFDPEVNAELGAKFVRQNAEGLKKSLGRDPTYGEVYASHHFGLSGAKNLFKKDPNMPMVEAVSPEVIKANPYLKDKTVGQVMATLNKKMGEGVVSLADGGIASAAPYYGYAAGGSVKHFVVGDLVQDNFGRTAGADIRTSQIVDDFGNVIEKGSKPKPAMSPFERLKAMKMGDISRSVKTAAVPAAVYEGGKYLTNASANTLSASPAMQEAYGSDYGDPGSDISIAAGAMRNADLSKKDLSSLGLEYYGSNNPTATAKKEAEDKKTSVKSTSPTDQELKDFDQATALFEAEQKNKAAPAGIDQAVPKKETGGLDDLIERLNKREAGYGKQKSIDNYMALLSAGLGMMGGTSPHAMANIGQGALMGVQNLSESNKLRAAEQGNLDKTMATALRYKEAQKAANQAREGTLGVRYAELAEKQKTHIANIMSNREKMAQSQAAAYLKANPIAGLNADDPTAISDMANKLLARDPAYLKAYETYNGFGFALPSGGGMDNLQSAAAAELAKRKNQ
jgi:hypothetical protein